MLDNQEVVGLIQAVIDCVDDRQAKDALAAKLQDKFGAWWNDPGKITSEARINSRLRIR